MPDAGGNRPHCGFVVLRRSIGGMDLGLSRAGFRHAFFCEADEWRRTIIERHWPGVPVHHDVRDVARADEWCADISPDLRRERDRSDHTGAKEREQGRHSGAVDLLAGGFPCQDLSVAGRRRGLDGERSGLFFEFARIADALVRPGGWVLVENVPGLLSSQSGRDFGIVLSTLADLGFMDGAWRVLDARFFGVPQRRRRVFIVARRARGNRARQVLLEPEGGRWDLAPRIETWASVAPGVGGGVEVAGSLSRRYGKGVNTTVDDGAVVVSTLGTTRGGGHGQRLDPSVEPLVTHTLTSQGFDASEDGTGRGTPLVVNRMPSTNHGGWRVGAEEAAGGALQVVAALDRRRGGADENEASGGQLIVNALGSTSISGTDDNSAQGGHLVAWSITPEGGQGADLRVARLGDTAPSIGTVTQSKGTDRGVRVTDGVGVRRLTPTECERLMGWPDGWTQPGADSRRYAACGDGVVAHVAEWIGRRLIAEINGELSMEVSA